MRVHSFLKDFFALPELPSFKIPQFYARPHRVSWNLCFYIQALDHACVILFSFLIIFLGLSLFRSLSITQALWLGGPSLWFSVLIQFLWWGLLYRYLGLFFFGHTLGTYFFRVESPQKKLGFQSFFSIFFESLGLSFPLLWLCDLFLRSQEYPKWGMTYLYLYSSIPNRVEESSTFVD